MSVIIWSTRAVNSSMSVGREATALKVFPGELGSRMYGKKNFEASENRSVGIWLSAKGCPVVGSMICFDRDEKSPFRNAGSMV